MPRKTFRKIITSPELIEQINPENKRLMERFLKNYSTKKSPNTIVNYRSNLNIFFCWNLENNDNISIINIKKYHLMDFFDYAATVLCWHSNRYCQCHSVLSSFCAWIERMYDEQYPNFRNLLPMIEKPVKSVVREKSVFKKSELDDLMEYLDSQGRIQEKCLLALMMSSGARVSELARFRTDIIDENNLAFEGLFLETTEKVKVKGRGVEGKYIEMYIIKDLFLPYYKEWLPIREEILKKHNQSHNYIFVTQNGNPATVATIRGWNERWDKYTFEKFGKHFYPHNQRHFNTSYLLGIGVEKELVQDLKKWSSDSLCDLYNDNTAKERKWKGLDKLKEALEQEKTKSNSVVDNDTSLNSVKS